MRKDWLIRTLFFVAALFSGGCGTMLQNLGAYPPGERYMEPYGGVKFCLENGSKGCKQLITGSENDNRVESLLGTTYWLGVDLPLSAAADTLTLPLTIHAVLKGDAVTAPVQWGGRDPWWRVVPIEQPRSEEAADRSEPGKTRAADRKNAETARRLDPPLRTNVENR